MKDLDANLIIANAPDPVFVSDLQGKILLANEAVSELLGLRKDEVLEQSLSRFVSRDEARELMGALHEVVERGVEYRCLILFSKWNVDIEGARLQRLNDIRIEDAVFALEYETGVETCNRDCDPRTLLGQRRRRRIEIVLPVIHAAPCSEKPGRAALVPCTGLRADRRRHRRLVAQGLTDNRAMDIDAQDLIKPADDKAESDRATALLNTVVAITVDSSTRPASTSSASSRSEKPPPFPTRTPAVLTATTPQTTRSIRCISATAVGWPWRAACVMDTARRGRISWRSRRSGSRRRKGRGLASLGTAM